MPWLGAANAFARAQTSAEEFRFLPRVEAALRHIGSGGFAEAMIRMMRLLSEATRPPRSRGLM